MTDELGVLTPSKIPRLKRGRTRLVFATRAEILTSFRDVPFWDAVYEYHETVIRMAHDGQFIVDLIPLDQAE